MMGYPPPFKPVLGKVFGTALSGALLDCLSGCLPYPIFLPRKALKLTISGAASDPPRRPPSQILGTLYHLFLHNRLFTMGDQLSRWSLRWSSGQCDKCYERDRENDRRRCNNLDDTGAGAIGFRSVPNCGDSIDNSLLFAGCLPNRCLHDGSFYVQSVYDGEE